MRCPMNTKITDEDLDKLDNQIKSKGAAELSPLKLNKET